jgi:hypothetical protein
VSDEERERMREMEERLRGLSEEDMKPLITSAIVGTDEFARELVRVGMSDEAHSPRDAELLRPYVMAAVEVTREERQG